ncbi:MAG: class I SAM-dependent methyltransferase [Candidatus Paceibacterota bacterium]
MEKKEEYNEITARHYAAYRPQLHEFILEKCLSRKETFENGLDIGCGTGISTMALAKYCTKVYGIDPSAAMLNKAKSGKNVKFLLYDGHTIPMYNRKIDLVTFSGSLNYAKSPLLIKELFRICHDNSIIISYDFGIILDDVLDQNKIKRKEKPGNYDFEVNFDDQTDFDKMKSNKEQIEITVDAKELAHILLSSTWNYGMFVKKFNESDPFAELLKNLKEVRPHWVLKTNVYYSKYKVT